MTGSGHKAPVRTEPALGGRKAGSARAAVVIALGRGVVLPRGQAGAQRQYEDTRDKQNRVVPCAPSKQRGNVMAGRPFGHAESAGVH